MRMLQVCAVDFTAFHMLRSLMHASRDDGWTVEFACADGPWVAALEAEGFRYRRVPMSRALSPLRQLYAVAALAWSLRRDPPDLVHTHTPIGGIVGRAAALLAWRRGPLVHTFHGLPLRTGRRSMGERVFLAVERLLAGRTTHFFSQAAGDVDRAVRLGIAHPARMTVIGNGVDVGSFTPNAALREEVRRELRLGPEDVMVLCVSRLVREKGLLDLADAAASLRREGRVHVLIAGRALPTDRTDLQRELETHEAARVLGPRWRLLGHRTDIARVLQAADIFVLPSYREGLPRSVIEAMAAGVAIITTDIPTCRELVEDGVSGLLVPVRAPDALAAAIRDLAGDQARRATFGANARARALARHDEREVVRRQVQTFRRLAVGH